MSDLRICRPVSTKYGVLGLRLQERRKSAGKQMRIAIMGSGGLGGYFGARLAQGGADVHFIARGKHLEAMCRQGLRIEGPEPMHLRDVRVTDRPAEAGVMDVVMLCVKLWDTE